MNVQLLDRTRKINKLLYNNNTDKVAFNDVCHVLSDCLHSNIYVISRKGKILGTAANDEPKKLAELITGSVGDHIDALLNERFLNVLSTQENVHLATLGFERESSYGFTAIISPIEVAGERLGTLFLYRENAQYSIDDIIVCEYGTTVVGLELLRSVNEEALEEKRKVSIVRSAFATLSYSEKQAILFIMDELGGSEGILVASKIADRVGITRSVIVNALRKFESAGVIESRSSGMKGTYIKVVNDYLFEEIKNIRGEQDGAEESNA